MILKSTPPHSHPGDKGFGLYNLSSAVARSAHQAIRLWIGETPDRIITCPIDSRTKKTMAFVKKIFYDRP